MLSEDWDTLMLIRSPANTFQEPEVEKTLSLSHCEYDTRFPQKHMHAASSLARISAMSSRSESAEQISLATVFA